MTYDVAGATFLAASTSAPELFVNFVGTFVTNGDIGLGTIVGSSVFNILVIAGVCGIFTQPVRTIHHLSCSSASHIVFFVFAYFADQTGLVAGDQRHSVVPHSYSVAHICVVGFVGYVV